MDWQDHRLMSYGKGGSYGSHSKRRIIPLNDRIQPLIEGHFAMHATLGMTPRTIQWYLPPTGQAYIGDRMVWCPTRARRYEGGAPSGEPSDAEERRWVDPYATEASRSITSVIDLKEFQGYKAEIETRRQGLLTQQGECECRQQEANELRQHGQTMIDYCRQVREQLKTFTYEEKRLVFDTLDLRITWTPGEPLRVQACIPIEPVLSIPFC